ncbi:MAG: hypothetical protein WAN36_08920 [Calditrichia bacterium]
MLRLILLFILFYLIYYLIKNVFLAAFTGAKKKSEMKGRPKKKVRDFDPGDIEDVDYTEIKKDRRFRNKKRSEPEN